MKKLFLSLLLMTLPVALALAQTQVVKGRILDAQASYPLTGATVIVAGTDPLLGTTTDLNGEFVLKNVPVGRQTLLAGFIGYKNQSLPNVLVTSGKEVVLEIMLEESVEQLAEVVVTPDADKDMPLNEFAKVSARSYNLEEVMRFSGGRNDVARLATNFAGVSTADDSRNDIVVRGNSPTGLLWRVEGMPIATTNHFATLGTTGGPVSALNPNLLRTSDFMTGAFPAEYGNALAAVFDVNFRNGNTDTYEFTGQLSAFSGLELMAEGPMKFNENASFVASYRYGIASIAATGTSAIPYYQDFNFKLNFGETRLGRFELYGLGGLSSIDFMGDEIDENDLFANPNEDAYVDNDLGLVGLNHTLRFGKMGYLETRLGVSTNANNYLQDNYLRDSSGQNGQKYRATEVENRENRYTLSSNYYQKFNARFNAQFGGMVEMFDVTALVRDRDNRAFIPDEDGDGIPDYLFDLRNTQETFALSRVYAQGEYRFTDQLSLSGGLHAQYLGFTEDFVLEPRAALSYQFRPNQRFSLAYGLHSQVVPFPVLFLNEEVAPGEFAPTNSDLGFIRSHHFVAGYDRKLGDNWRLKAEAYYQRVFDVPVEHSPSSYSVVNEGAGFVFDERPDLVNEGTARNYGVELTLEKFFSKGYYVLVTTSVFDSKYEGSDGVLRNTAFNNQYVLNVLGGKEWKLGSNGNKVLTFDTKFSTSGGRPYTPIDLAATRANAGREVFMENVAFSETLGNYLRWDVKFGIRLNNPNRKLSHQFFLDLQNVTNRRNEFVRRYNEVTDQINLVEQIGFFPDVMYRVQF